MGGLSAGPVVAGAADDFGVALVGDHDPAVFVTVGAGVDLGEERLLPRLGRLELGAVPGFGVPARVAAWAAGRRVRGAGVLRAAIWGAGGVRFRLGGLVTYPCYVTL